MKTLARGSILLSLGLIACLYAAAQDSALVASEKVVAGGEGDFATVRYLRLEGGQLEIGAHLAKLAREQHGWSPTRGVEPMRTAAQRAYFARNAPLFLERMRGVAGAAGVEVDDDALNLSSLSYGFARPGCTVVHFPPAFMASGKSVVSRNFDFTTGTFQGKRPGADEVAVCGAPYILETHPSAGYAALTICAYDLLGGVVDGINSEGLVIALLADDEASQLYDLDAAKGPQAGFGVVQVGRHILETCADVDEAKAALLEAKLYYTSIPCHYMIADRHGRAFVWENSVFMTQGYVIEDPGEPLVTTNFLHHLHPDRAQWPEETQPWGSFRRARAVLERVEASEGGASLDFVRDASSCVAATVPAGNGPWAPGRTLWHALYVPEDRSLQVDFYLGEASGGGQRRSGYLAFALE